MHLSIQLIYRCPFSHSLWWYFKCDYAAFGENACLQCFIKVCSVCSRSLTFRIGAALKCFIFCPKEIHLRIINEFLSMCASVVRMLHLTDVSNNVIPFYHFHMTVFIRFCWRPRKLPEKVFSFHKSLPLHLKVSLTPGLVLPCYMYQGIVFQLVACVPIRVTKTKSSTSTSSVGNDGWNKNTGTTKSICQINNPLPSRPVGPGVGRTHISPTSGATRKRRRPSGTIPTIAGLVLAQGGDYTHLVLKHCLPREYGVLKLVLPIFTPLLNVSVSSLLWWPPNGMTCISSTNYNWNWFVENRAFKSEHFLRIIY